MDIRLEYVDLETVYSGGRIDGKGVKELKEMGIEGILKAVEASGRPFHVTILYIRDQRRIVMELQSQTEAARALYELGFRRIPMEYCLLDIDHAADFESPLLREMAVSINTPDYSKLLGYS